MRARSPRPSLLPASPGGEHPARPPLPPSPSPSLSLPCPSLPAPLGHRGEAARRAPAVSLPRRSWAKGWGKVWGGPWRGGGRWGGCPYPGGWVGGRCGSPPPLPASSHASPALPPPPLPRGAFSAQLRVEPRGAARLLRASLFPFILCLLVVFNVFSAFPRAAAPRRYCLRAGGAWRAGAGRGPPAAGGERPPSVCPGTPPAPSLPPLPRYWNYRYPDLKKKKKYISFQPR